MNKMQKAIATLTKLDKEWLAKQGLEESFRSARVGTRECLKDLFCNGVTYSGTMWLIKLRRKDAEGENNGDYT